MVIFKQNKYVHLDRIGCFGHPQKLNDPELVIYFMDILKPLRLSTASEEAKRIS